MDKLPTMLKKKIKEICRRYGVSSTLYGFVDYIRTHNSAEYDQLFADDMEEAYRRYLDRRRK